jgi:hypothetical protein
MFFLGAYILRIKLPVLYLELFKEAEMQFKKKNIIGFA